MVIYQVSITVILGILLCNTLINLWVMRRPKDQPIPATGPLVSVLVPARDEERNIAQCVIALVRQDYPWLEILVYDDQSTDRTAAIVAELA